MLPGALVGQVMRLAAVQLLVHDVHQDVAIWARRTHVARPALARGDGPVGPFRAWARQFHPGAPERLSEAS